MIEIETFPEIRNDTFEESTQTSDILGNGSLVKTVIRNGLGRESRPNHGDNIMIQYMAKTEDGTVVIEPCEISLVLGEGDVHNSIEIALPLAEKNEIFLLKSCARFAFGESGDLPKVPPDCSIVYYVLVKDVNDPPEYESMNIDQRIDCANKKRERGNYLFRRNEFNLSINLYDKAIQILTVCTEDKENEEARNLLIKIWNNLAANHLKLCQYDCAISQCDNILEIDPENVKALFRKGKAYLSFGDTDNALPLFEKVLMINPNCQLTKNHLTKAKHLLTKEKRQLARAASKAFFQTTQLRARSNKLSHRSRFRQWLANTNPIIVSTIIVVILSILAAYYWGLYSSDDTVSFDKFNQAAVDDITVKVDRLPDLNDSNAAAEVKIPPKFTIDDTDASSLRNASDIAFDTS